MLLLSEELKQKLEETNRDLRRAYPRDLFNRDGIRDRLTSIGRIYMAEKWDGQQMKEWLGERTLVGVDGSVNTTPGTHPHTLSVFQALAKGTRGEEKWSADLYTPLLEEEEEGAEGQLAREAKHRGRLLAGLEIQVALYAIRNWTPRVVMMDGSLLHFLIDHADAWEELVKAAEQADVLLVGVSEEIETKSLARTLFPEQGNYSDREILFGVMKPGEVYVSAEMDPPGTGLWKAVLSPSKHPQPVGVDGSVKPVGGPRGHGSTGPQSHSGPRAGHSSLAGYRRSGSEGDGCSGTRHGGTVHRSGPSSPAFGSQTKRPGSVTGIDCERRSGSLASGGRDDTTGSVCGIQRPQISHQ